MAAALVASLAAAALFASLAAAALFASLAAAALFASPAAAALVASLAAAALFASLAAAALVASLAAAALFASLAAAALVACLAAAALVARLMAEALVIMAMSTKARSQPLLDAVVLALPHSDFGQEPGDGLFLSEFAVHGPKLGRRMALLEKLVRKLPLRIGGLDGGEKRLEEEQAGKMALDFVKKRFPEPLFAGIVFFGKPSQYD